MRADWKERVSIAGSGRSGKARSSARQPDNQPRKPVMPSHKAENPRMKAMTVREIKFGCDTPLIPAAS
jgi:hypothetical protein